MSSEKAAVAVDPAVSLLRNPPWWLLLFIGASGGGGLGTLLSRPVFAGVEDTITKTDVQDIVDASITRNNGVLLQQIELILARDKLTGAGLSSPVLRP